MTRYRVRLQLFGGAISFVWLMLYLLGRTWGSTRDERSRVLPGDNIVPRPDFVTDHAVTIDAPPSAVWPWLKQVGWHRAGWYTYEWVDRLLFPANAPSAQRVLPELQELSIGDAIPDGPPESGCFFRVEDMAPERHLVLHSTTHLPRKLLQDPRVQLSWTWTFVLEPVGNRCTRFHFRCRASLRPFWLRVPAQMLIVPADFVMGRSMCLGLKQRVEAAGRSAAATTQPGGSQ